MLLSSVSFKIYFQFLQNFANDDVISIADNTVNDISHRVRNWLYSATIDIQQELFRKIKSENWDFFGLIYPDTEQSGNHTFNCKTFSSLHLDIY